MVVPQREDAEQLETTVSVVLLPQASIVYIYIYIYTQPFIYGWYQDIYQNIRC